jgi:tetratricopeptide (TPR) repeat protein
VCQPFCIGRCRTPQPTVAHSRADNSLDTHRPPAQAASRLASIRLKEGSWSKARELYTNNAEKLQKIEIAEQQTDRANALFAARDFAAAIDLAGQALEIAPSSEPLRMLRARAYVATPVRVCVCPQLLAVGSGSCCAGSSKMGHSHTFLFMCAPNRYLEVGQTGEAIGDVTRATKLSSGNVEAYFLLSQLHFKTGDRVEALKQIRECVKLDADHKLAFKFYKKLKKFNKVLDKVDETMQKNRFGEAVKNIERAQELENEEHYYVNDLKTKTCGLYVKLNRLDKAKEACEDALKFNGRNVEALISRAEIWEQEQEYQKSIDDIKAAQDIEADSQRLKDKVARCVHNLAPRV